MKKCPQVLFLTISLISTIASSCNNSEEKEGSIQTTLETESKPVKILKLQNTLFNNELISNGTVTAEEKADLRFEISEIIEEIYVKNGQYIKKGDKIATLSQFKLKNAVTQAIDNLEKAKLDMQDILISQGYAIKDSLEIPSQTLQIAKVKSNVNSLTTQYQLALYNLKNSVLYAPFSGTIANISAKKFSTSNTSEPFCTILSNNSIGINFTILENELQNIKNGDKVIIYPLAFDKISLTGKIQQINPIVDEHGMITIRAEIVEPTAKLLDGMTIRAKIQQSSQNHLVVPKSAIVLRNNKKVVFTAQDGKALWNYVTTGPENSEGIVILDGLKAGDNVIYEGNINLAHNTTIPTAE